MRRPVQLFSLLLALSAAPVLAASPEARQAGSVPYVSGGVGFEERDALSASARQYNLKLIFAAREYGSYMSDVRVHIQGARGADVLEAVAEGPWFFAKLPPGTYQVTASAGEQRQTRRVTVGGGRLVQETFRFR